MFAGLTIVAIVCYAIIRALLASTVSSRFADQPNERSLHAQPVPRIGGIGIVTVAIIVGLLVGLDIRLLGATLALALLSLADDWRGLPAAVRFATHFIAATTVVFTLLDDTSGWWLLACVIGVVWMTNLYNFMDGADGLAGGMTMFGFATYAIAAAWGGDESLAMFCAALAVAAAAFLLLNFHPARVFMGDVGSIPLGFLAAVVGLMGYVRGLWPPWMPVVVFMPFVADASVTLARRLARGERVWHAHRTHYYQRLVRSGVGHMRVALLEYLAMSGTALGALATIGRDATTQTLIVGLIVAAHGAAGWVIDRRWSRWSAATS